MRSRIKFSIHTLEVFLCLTALIGALISGLHAELSPRAKVRSAPPPSLNQLDMESHDVSAVYLILSNQGPIGLNLETGGGTGFFPSNTSNNYVFGTGLWFGARFDGDGDGDLDKVFVQGYNPLAGDSEFREGPNELDQDDPLTRIFDSTEPDDIADWPERFSEVDSLGRYTPFIRSDQDLVTTYTTQDRNPVFGSFQLPLQVDQRSMAFKTGLAGQAIFFILDIENWGDDVLEDAWAGYDSDMDVGVSFSDDLTSFIRDRITPDGDTVRVNMAYAWDSDFVESNFTGDPGFVGIAYLRSPGNPNDGIDNDSDGLVDESPYNGIDDDGDGDIDEADEVDELGLVNYSKHCSPSVPCELADPQTDEDGYDLLSCISENNPDSSSQFVCLESTTPSDVRFMMSSGPFDWLPGQTQQVVLAMVFANPTGDRYLPFAGDPPRPNPNDDDLVELLEVKDVIQGIFDIDFTNAVPPGSFSFSLSPGDGQVTILWNDAPIRTPDPYYDVFVELDSTYREFDFEGFRVWRSKTGSFSRRGDPEDPDFPLTPEAILENELVDGFDLSLLAQFDLANGITTDSNGVTCHDSLITDEGLTVYTDCDTFNLGTDTGVRFSYIDQGDPGDPLINGLRYYYCVTAYDYNSDKLPVSRLSLDSGVSFTEENSGIPIRRTDILEVDSDLTVVDSDGNALDDSSLTFDPDTGKPVDLSINVASNALVDFSFLDFDPEKISSSYHTVVLDSFERIDFITNRIRYHIEDENGTDIYTPATVFDLPYDGDDHTIVITAFDPDDFSQLYAADLTFNADTAAFVMPVPSEHLLARNDLGSDMSDSLGNVTMSTANFIPAGFRGADIEMEWIAVDEAGDSLTLDVRDLDNMVDVPFGEGIVTETGQMIDSEKGSNWSFLPVGSGAIQPGGRYFLTGAPTPVVDLWSCGVRLISFGMYRMPQDGDVWTLRQLSMTFEVDTTVTPPDTTYFEAQRPPVPGTRYRLDFSPARDITAPDFTIGIFQNTVLTTDLDVYVVASEVLDSLPVMTIAGDTVSLDEIESEEVEIYSNAYRLTQSGTYSVEVTGLDTWGNEGEGSEDFSAGLITRRNGGFLASTDNVLKLTVPPDAIREESKYFLCMTEGDIGSGIDPNLYSIDRMKSRQLQHYASSDGELKISTGSRPVKTPFESVPVRSTEQALNVPNPKRASTPGDAIARGRAGKRDPSDKPDRKNSGSGIDLHSESSSPLSPIYSLSPSGERLVRFAEIAFDLGRLKLTDSELQELGIYLWTEDGWSGIESHVNSTTKRITATVDLLGSYQLRTKGITGASPLPRVFNLSQNFPNPFNPSTTIGFDIPEGRSEVWTELIIYNVRGQRVRTLLRNHEAPGSYFIQWDGRDDHGQSVASGLYLYRLKAGDFTSTRKMVLVK